mgnify:CR=1 FL=1
MTTDFKVRIHKSPFLLILDRDGTVIEDKGYLSDPAGVELELGATEGLRAMLEAGAIPVVITNQSGVARGYFSRAAVDAIHDRLDELLARQGLAIKAYLVCPHGLDEGCECRKPGAALALRAAAETGLPLSDAYVIGDKLSDIGLAAVIGATGILVRTGEGHRHAGEAARRGFAVASDLAEAARLVIAARDARSDQCEN